MRTSKQSKAITKYSILSVVLTLIISSVLVADGFYRRSHESQLRPTAESPSAQGSPQVWIFSEDLQGNAQGSRCASTVFYTSLPAKCVDADGNLIPVSQPVLIVPSDDK